MLVLAAHLLLLMGRMTGPQDGARRGGRVAALQVRQIVVPAARVATTPSTNPMAAAAVPVAGAAKARPPGAPKPARAPQPPPVAPALAAAPSAAADARPATADAPPPAAEAEGMPLPAYATRLPPAATLRYTLRRGSQVGQADLRWQPSQGQYLLTLDSTGPGGPALGSASEGAIGDGGVAPERHVDSRRGRALRAVNFQHEAGRISFSGPSQQLPLHRGAQDRLSWMVQLPAVLAAEPALREPGSEVRLFVVGTRGDAEVWIFAVLGRESAATDAGPVAEALHLRREARRPYDTQVDVWLDPARHHLPVQVRQTWKPGGAETELRLAAFDTP